MTTYGGFFQRFMTEHAGDGPRPFQQLDASVTSTFVQRHAHTMNPGRAKLMVTVLRSMLRFFLQRGLIDAGGELAHIHPPRRPDVAPGGERSHLYTNPASAPQVWWSHAIQFPNPRQPERRLT